MGSFLSSLINPAEAAANSAVVAIHNIKAWDAHFAAHLSSNKLMVVDFSASWCGPCEIIEPLFRAYSLKFPDVDFVTIDVDELGEVAGRFKVQAMPTFVLFKGGKEITRVVGAKKEDLERKIVQFKG